MKTAVKETMLDLPLMVQPIELRGELDVIALPRDPASSAAAAPRSLWLPSRLFTLVVLVPLILGGIYNFVIASDRFVSYASFIVRKSAAAGAAAPVLQSAGLSRSDDSSYAIAKFLTSRDAVGVLDASGELRGIFGAEGVDVFSQFPTLNGDASDEALYRHLQDYITADFDTSTGISTIAVQAFVPDDSRRLAEMLLEAAEVLINRLNDRARDDAVTFTADMVDAAYATLDDAQRKMTDFRNREQVIDPQNEVQLSNRLMTSLLRDLGETNALLSQIEATSRDNPRVAGVRLRRDAIQKNIDELQNRVSGNEKALSEKIEGYEAIELRRDLARKSLANAVAAHDMARQEANSGRLYLERVVQPSLPDSAGYPKRFQNMLLLLAVSLGVFWIVRKTTELLLEER